MKQAIRRNLTHVYVLHICVCLQSEHVYWTRLQSLKKRGDLTNLSDIQSAGLLLWCLCCRVIYKLLLLIFRLARWHIEMYRPCATYMGSIPIYIPYQRAGAFRHQGTRLLTWINFNLTRISNYIHWNMWDEITYPFPNFNGVTVEVWEWISNVIPHFTRHVIFIHVEIEVKPC